MNAVLGTAGVTLGLAATLVGVATLLIGLRRHDPRALRMGRRYAFVAFGGALLAFLAMEKALVTHDFSLQYVANNHSRATPLLYTIASLWGALEGSIILWALVLSGYTIAAVRRFRDRADDPLVAWATLTMLAVGAFFFALLLGPANPFKVLADIPANGRGPTPLLQD